MNDVSDQFDFGGGHTVEDQAGGLNEPGAVNRVPISRHDIRGVDEDGAINGGNDDDSFATRIVGTGGVTDTRSGGGSGGDDFRGLGGSELRSPSREISCRFGNAATPGPSVCEGTTDLFERAPFPSTTISSRHVAPVTPCFTPGTMIATPQGERPVTELKPGDRVITCDNGIQEIRWIGARQLNWRMLSAQPHLRPVLIRKGALGRGLPERDMMVSPNHRVLVANDQTQLAFDEREVLVAAKHLVNNAGISSAACLGVSYLHILFDRHEVVLSDGTWTESFRPDDVTLKGIGNAQRGEIFELFPELRTQAGLERYASARRDLKADEAKMLHK